VASKLLRLNGIRCIAEAPAWAGRCTAGLNVRLFTGRGLATLSPPLDEAGNRVRGQLAAPFLSAQLGLNLFTS